MRRELDAHGGGGEGLVPDRGGSAHCGMQDTAHLQSEQGASRACGVAVGDGNAFLREWDRTLSWEHAAVLTRQGQRWAALSGTLPPDVGGRRREHEVDSRPLHPNCKPGA